MGDFETREAGKREFHDYVRKTYEGLVRLEALPLSAKTSICVFCRFDIGIILGKNGVAHYFVNEVERTPTASLWSNKGNGGKGNGSIGILGATFGTVLHRWITALNNPFAF